MRFISLYMEIFNTESRFQIHGYADIFFFYNQLFTWAILSVYMPQLGVFPFF